MKKCSEPLTARLEDAKIEEFSGEIETGGLGNFNLHGQNDGGRVSEIGLDTNEGGVIDGLSSEEVGSGNGLRFVRSNLLHCTFHTDHTFSCCTHTICSPREILSPVVGRRAVLNGGHLHWNTSLLSGRGVGGEDSGSAICISSLSLPLSPSLSPISPPLSLSLSPLPLPLPLPLSPLSTPPTHNYYPHWQATKPPQTTKGLAATFESLPFTETHTHKLKYTAPLNVLHIHVHTHATKPNTFSHIRTFGDRTKKNYWVSLAVKAHSQACVH